MRLLQSSLSHPRRRGILLGLLLGTICAVGMLSFSAQESPAELTGPQASDRQVTLVVGSLLRRQHLSGHELDDEISQRALQTFLRQLDPMKLYFYQSDIDEFMEYENQIDDLFADGEIGLAYDIFGRLLERIDERMVTVNELLEAEHDFTIDEEFITDTDILDYPTDAADAAERWRKRVKYDLLLLKANDELEGELARERLARRYFFFAQRMQQFDSDELLELYLNSITTAYDPHTTYMSRSTHENFLIAMRLNLQGIGAALQTIDGYTVVSKVIPGGAAALQGELQAEDRIVSVGQGEDGEMVDVEGMKLGSVVNLIRGEAGTIVRLGVVHKDEQNEEEPEVVTIRIERAEVQLTDQEARGEVLEAGVQADGTPFLVGVINLPSFYMDMTAARNNDENAKSTTRDVRVILDSFKQQGVQAVVLDLRHNGGGSLSEAINLTGLFIDRGPVVQVQGPTGSVLHLDDEARGMEWEGPLVVLTSKESASASEILAGAIQDYHRGLIVGDHSTHGKGTVQSLLDLGEQLFRADWPNLGALKITMQQFYRPNGDSTQLRGVLADIELPSLSSNAPGGEDELDYAVDFDRVPPARFSTYSEVTEAILEQLRTRSQERIEQSADFQELHETIARYLEYKERDSVTLNEEAFLAEREEWDALRHIEGEEEDPADEGEAPVVVRDFYFEEVLAITHDYADLLDSGVAADSAQN